MKCDLCLCPITKEEIEAHLTFGFQHPCGRYGNYHACCAMNALDAVKRFSPQLYEEALKKKPQGEKEMEMKK